MKEEKRLEREDTTHPSVLLCVPVCSGRAGFYLGIDLSSSSLLAFQVVKRNNIKKLKMGTSKQQMLSSK